MAVMWRMCKRNDGSLWLRDTACWRDLFDILLYFSMTPRVPDVDL